MNSAVEGIQDARDACSLIKALAEWGDVRLVPAFIAFLRNGESAGFSGDDLFIPALKAKTALHKLTGHYFAYEVESSRRAWESAQQIEDPVERARKLDQLQPDDPFPLKAVVTGNGTSKAVVRVTNKSGQTVTIARWPTWVTETSSTGVGGCDFGGPEGNRKPDFTVLKPGQSVELRVTFSNWYLRAEPDSRRLTLAYTENGSHHGVNAWIGVVKAEFGPGWTEPKKNKR